MPRTLHIVSPAQWIGEAVSNGLAGCRQQWDIAPHRGLEPPNDIAGKDAVWIAPGLLIALNAWLTSQGGEPILLEVPPWDWLERLPEPMLGRHAISACANDIRQWQRMPQQLGPRPWSQIANGRVSAFPAVRRDLRTLQAALGEAPSDSIIQISGHVEGIADEWFVLIHQGGVAASSGYCIHLPTGGRIISTVFDGAAFPPEHRRAAESTALEAATFAHGDGAGGTGTAGVLVAFSESREEPAVIELTPVWCSSPYPYDPAGMQRFLEAVAGARLLCQPSRNRAGGAAGAVVADLSGNPVEPDRIFRPDPWMVREFAGRYRGFTRAQ